MASAVRTPFAPLDETRLQNLTSNKNRQNGFISSANKRKAPDVTGHDDYENVDPTLFSKRSKNSAFHPSKVALKAAAPSAFSVHKGFEISHLSHAVVEPPKAISGVSRRRAILNPKAPSTRLHLSVNPVTARRSLLSSGTTDASTRGVRRGGILSNKRRVASSFMRDEPVPAKGFRVTSSVAAAPAMPFSLDAALRGTLSAYASAATSVEQPVRTSQSLFDGYNIKQSWNFEIHEDTPEQEMTNLLQHSTCVLDISSDEESEQKARHARAEGRDKENIPPANDISQTSRVRVENFDDMFYEKSRSPLSQLNAADFYDSGCDETSVVIVPSDEHETENDTHDTLVNEASPSAPTSTTEEATEAALKAGLSVSQDGTCSADDLMSTHEEPAAKAAVLQPIDGTGENFDLWESVSAKDESMHTQPPSPICGVPRV